MANVVTLISLRNSSIPVIATEHSDPALYRIGTLNTLLRRITYLRAASVTVTSARAAKYFNWLSPCRVTVMPNPVMHFGARAHPATPTSNGRFIVVSAGRLIPSKSFDVLILAFSRLAKDFPNWDLLIFGDGTERQSLESLVASLGLEARVKLPGSIRELETYMAEAHVFAFPSRFEGFGLALCEAMAVGLPCITFDGISGVENLNINGKSGITVSGCKDRESEISRFSEAMARLMSSGLLRNQLGAAAHELSKSFSPAKIWSSWEKLIEEIS